MIAEKITLVELSEEYEKLMRRRLSEASHEEYLEYTGGDGQTAMELEEVMEEQDV